MNGQSLRVVAISDSHGFERGLHVPDGDVLVHCGDFAPASKVRAGMDSFGRWLSSLPHPYKIVVRGNHDPERIPALATYSDVLFVHRPATLNISGVRFAVAPYPVKGKVHKGLATSGSVHPSAKSAPRPSVTANQPPTRRCQFGFNQDEMIGPRDQNICHMFLLWVGNCNATA